ncbi:MAG: hypothetical protein J6B68_04665 [Lachnospiraceae bacterium]|nr:hypothetical protein [Lachnospiraceae bacterium]
MKKWKRIVHNCPYLIALFITWLFFTIGSIVLLWYRGYGSGSWRDILEMPVFAVAVTEEMQGKMAEPAVIASDKETVVIDEKQKENTVKDNKIVEKLNANIIKADFNKENTDEEINTEINTEAEQQTSKRQPDQTLIEAAKALEEQQNELSEGENQKGALTEDGMANAEGGAGTAQSGGNEAYGENGIVYGQTRYEIYTPIETDSIYYSDAGKVAYTTDYEYRKVPESYFKDAAFLGDSRTLGISDYAGLEADFYCESGMTIYKLFDEKGVTYQKNGQKVNLGHILQQKQYGKIYIMLGMNELGYGDTEKYLEQYKTVVEQIREWQPEAVIFILANLHVSQTRNDMETEFNNVNINDKNAAAASLADGMNIFYLDSNPLFVDKDGFLKADLTFDGVHLYANNYEAWKEFLMEHGVVKDDEGRTGDSTK